MLINLQFELYAHDVVVPDLVVESARGSDGGGHGELAGQVGRRNERRRKGNLIHFSFNSNALYLLRVHIIIRHKSFSADHFRLPNETSVQCKPVVGPSFGLHFRSPA
jgi:hypothetical protein